MPGPTSGVWTELRPCCESDEELIDSLWCTKLRAKYTRREKSYKSKHEQLFLGCPRQDKLHVKFNLNCGWVKVNLLNWDAQLLETDEVYVAESVTAKHITLDMAKLKGMGGIVKVYIKYTSEDLHMCSKVIMQNLVIFVKANMTVCLWTELFPTSGVWTALS